METVVGKKEEGVLIVLIMGVYLFKPRIESHEKYSNSRY